MISIFTKGKLIKYAETRLFGRNLAPEDIGKIELYNGILPSSLEQAIRRDHGDFERVVQENGREPIYFYRPSSGKGTLLIPQYSGFGRGERYRRLIEEYIAVSGKNMAFEIHHLNNNERDANIYYENHAYDFVAGLFVPSEKYEDRIVFPSCDIKDIRKIIFGSIDAIARATKIIAKGQSEYLDAQIAEIKGEKILNIGPVYADQAKHIIYKMLREYAALAEDKGKKLEIDLFMFGRVGGLDDKLQRNDLVYPTAIIDDVDLKNGKRFEYPMHNVLSQGKSELNFNVPTIVDESIEQLEEARKNGCVCVEMESRESAEAVNDARRWFHRFLGINFGFVGYVSDLPLKDDTLADEHNLDEGEQAALGKIIEFIKRK